MILFNCVILGWFVEILQQLFCQVPLDKHPHFPNQAPTMFTSSFCCTLVYRVQSLGNLCCMANISIDLRIIFGVWMSECPEIWDWNCISLSDVEDTNFMSTRFIWGTTVTTTFRCTPPALPSYFAVTLNCPSIRAMSSPQQIYTRTPLAKVLVSQSWSRSH